MHFMWHTKSVLICESILFYFAGELGGCLGLTFGASLLTIMEVVEYIVDSIKQLCHSKTKGKDTQPPIQVKPTNDK